MKFPLSAFCNDFCLNEEKNILYCANDDKKVCIYDVRIGLIEELVAHSDSITCIDID